MRYTKALTVTAFCILGWFPANLVVGAEPLPVFVSIPPQKYFVEKVGGKMVDVSVMVQPGANPHVYEPKPNQMVALSKGKIYFAIGMTFEDVWLPRFAAANPKLVIIHSEEGIEKMPMIGHEHHESPPKQSGKMAQQENQVAPGTLDPHVWLSPPETKVIAGNLRKALQAADPSNSEAYEANYRRFATEIEDLDAQLRSIFAGKKGTKFMVFHPSWGYFARTYALEQVPIEIEGKEPKPAQMKALIEDAKKEGIKLIFVQPQFSTKSAEMIAKAIGGQVVFADPLSPDWANNLRQQAEKFRSALQ